MRRQDRRAGQQPAQVRRRSPAGRGAGAAPAAARRTARSVPSAASIVIAATTSAVRASVAARSVREDADRQHALRAVHEREALLRLERRAARGRPAPSRPPARLDAALGAEHLAVADQRQREVGERGQVAGGPERTLLRHGRDHVLGSASRPSGRRRSGAPPSDPSASTCARSSSIARASSRESGAPTAVACERTMPCCSAEACDGSTRVSASAPNPVVTP